MEAIYFYERRWKSMASTSIQILCWWIIGNCLLEVTPSTDMMNERIDEKNMEHHDDIDRRHEEF